MTGALKILRIEVDGHYHGSSDVPKPWVAQIDGVDAKYGLARTFVQRLNDYRGARRDGEDRLRWILDHELDQLVAGACGQHRARPRLRPKDEFHP